MQRVPVSSSNLASVGYVASQQVLEIEFLNRRIYQYFGVPIQIYTGLMNASSHGSYFNSMIKDAGYPYRRIR